MVSYNVSWSKNISMRKLTGRGASAASEFCAWTSVAAVKLDAYTISVRPACPKRKTDLLVVIAAGTVHNAEDIL